MTTKSVIVQDAVPEVLQKGPAPARPLRFRLQLTAQERKMLLVFGDLVQMNGSLLVAVTLWGGFPLSPINVLFNAKWLVTLSLLWLVVGTVLDVYNLARAASTTTIVGTAGVAALVTSLLYVMIPWLTPPIENRRYVFGFVALGITTIAIWRAFYALALAQPNFRRRALILGAGQNALEAADDLVHVTGERAANPFRGTGYEVMGLITPVGASLSPAQDTSMLLGDINQLVTLARQHHIDEIVVATDDDEVLTAETFEVLLDCRELGLQVTTLAAVHERLSARLPVDYARHDPTIILAPTDSAAARLFLGVKRTIDLLFALIGMAALIVLAPCVALGNALSSPGPLFYYQERVGKGGCPYKVVKFRSMGANAEADCGAVWAGKSDPRVTPLGYWLRRLRLDELPQVINVLRGEMSVVGPRPERPQFVGELSHRMPLYRARHAVKPGITGWAQTHYGYGSSVEDARIKLEYDLYYVKHASIYLDLMIILQTIAVMLQLKGR